MRVMVTSWQLFCLVVSAVYTSNLMAFVAVRIERVPYKTLREVAAQEEYKIGTLGGTIVPNLMQVSVCKT